MTERRFTDREVALVLRRAADLEKGSSGTAVASGKGLTLSDLREIAAEAGIDPDLVSRAVMEMEGSKGIRTGSLLAGPGTVQREVRAFPEELSRQELADLIRVVDAEVRDQGTVQEALGHVRWTSQGRFLSTQVSLEPGGGETLMRVEERYNDAIRGILHGIPAGYGVIFGLAGATEGLNLTLGPGALLVAASAAAGWGVGAAIWRRLARGSRSRVQKLAERLGLRAREMAKEQATADREGEG